ncbi:putative BTB domain-containing protein [Seiridium cardinale]
MESSEFLKLRVVERDHIVIRFRGQAYKELPVKRTRDFLVRRKALEENTRLLKKHPDGIDEAGVLTLDDSNIAAVELWKEKLHDRLVNLSTYNIGHWWHAVAFGLDYCNEPEILGEWFSEWLAKDGIRATAYQKLVPAFHFHCVEDFAEITKNQVYGEVEAIGRRPPEGAEHLHWRMKFPVKIPGDILDDLRAAHESTKEHLAAFWFDLPADVDVHCSDVACQKAGEFLYFRSLRDTGIWPIHKISYSLSYLFDRFSKFYYIFDEDTGNQKLCSKHSTLERARSIEAVVRRMVENLRYEFEGLCLDCIKYSKLESFNDDYWTHLLIRDYSYNCCWVHGEPTWYFSFMARPEIIKKLQEAQYKKEKEEQQKQQKQQQ